MRKPAWKSRKFWVGVCGFAVLLINEIWGIDIDSAALWAVASPILVYIIGESWVDGQKA